MTELRAIPFTDRYYAGDDGHVYSSAYGRLARLRAWQGTQGHQKVGLRVGGRTIRLLVHRIVATCFHGPPPGPRMEARHLDGDPTNNVPANIAWGTHAENMADMVRHGRQGAYTHPERVARGERHSSRTKPWAIPRGERHPCARVTEEQVRAVRRLHSTLGSISATARALGISRDTAKFILNGRTWRHVQS